MREENTDMVEESSPKKGKIQMITKKKGNYWTERNFYSVLHQGSYSQGNLSTTHSWDHHQLRTMQSFPAFNVLIDHFLLISGLYL